jgi:hypothetical protein
MEPDPNYDCNGGYLDSEYFYFRTLDREVLIIFFLHQEG